MNLGEYIIQYRIDHDLSRRQFASLCGLSNGYISMIENNLNPKTKQPIVPSVDQLYKIASSMNISLTELFEKVDDMPIALNSIVKSFSNDRKAPVSDSLTVQEKLFLARFRSLDDTDKGQIMGFMAAILAAEKYSEKKKAM